MGTVGNMFRPESSDTRMADMALQLSKQTGLLTQIAGEQASILNVTLRAVNAHKDAIAHLSNVTHLFLQPALSNSTEFASAVRQVHLALLNIQVEVRRFMAAWHLARTEATLSPYFVDPWRLSAILSNLTTVLPPELALPVDPIEPATAHFYYAAIRVVPQARNNATFLMLHVPLVFPDRRLQIYEAFPWPVAAPQNPAVFTYFSPEAQYVATDERRSFHLLLTRADMELCDFDRELKVCRPKVAMHRDASSCSFSLLMSDAAGIAKLCEPLYTAPPPPRFLAFRNGQSWAYTLPAPGTLALAGSNGTILQGSKRSIPANGILHLPS